MQRSIRNRYKSLINFKTQNIYKQEKYKDSQLSINDIFSSIATLDDKEKKNWQAFDFDKAEKAMEITVEC